MRKQVITVFLLLIWFSQLSGRYFVMLDFYLNQDFIAQTLCINRDKPQMHCNGHCQLSKKLNEESKKNQESPERRTDNRSEIFYAALFQKDLLTPLFTIVAKNYLHPDCIGSPIDQATAVFHPPTA